MRARLHELLSTLETLTTDARRECATDMTRALILIRVRHTGISELCDLLTHCGFTSSADLERIRNIEAEGAELLKSIQGKSEELRDTLRIGARQRAFANCVTGILSLPQ
jgi:hypothetical protein